MKKERVVFLNLFQIKLPLVAVISLIHRISGLLLIIAIPFAIYCMQLSLQGDAGFQQAITLLSHPVVRLLEVILFALLMFHLFAGLRFLLIDLELGLSRRMASLSSQLVLLATFVVTLLFGLWSLL